MLLLIQVSKRLSVLHVITICSQVSQTGVFFAIQSAKYMLAICYRYLLGLVGKKVQETLLKIPVLVTTKTAGDVVMSPLKHLFFL